MCEKCIKHEQKFPSIHNHFYYVMWLHVSATQCSHRQAKLKNHKRVGSFHNGKGCLLTVIFIHFFIFARREVITAWRLYHDLKIFLNTHVYKDTLSLTHTHTRVQTHFCQSSDKVFNYNSAYNSFGVSNITSIFQETAEML
jgi:hypothetical protein